MSRLTRHFYEFGSFRVDAKEGLLLHDTEIVPLSPKSFDMLLALVDQRCNWAVVQVIETPTD